jgi:cell division transport system ATP-binding protein
MIRFENVSLSYEHGHDVLKDVSFSLAAGSFCFLTGASGAGKSSLLRLLYLGVRPTGGHITLFDKRVDEVSREALPPLRRRIGVVFQEFRLLPHLSALDNVALPLRLAGNLAEPEIRTQVTELLRWVGLGDCLHASPMRLSGGQQQRIAIARAVIARPRLLVADEPTGNVDDDAGIRLMHLFAELNRLGTTVIVATHNRNLIEKMARPQLHLKDGKLV